MIKKVKGNKEVCETFIGDLRSRINKTDKNIEKNVSEILENVKNNGDRAIHDYSVKFDGWAPDRIELSHDEMEEIASECDENFSEALKRASVNIEKFHKRQLQQSRIDTDSSGVIMGQRIRPLEKVGVYVPGGTAAYPSSVLMNIIPAKIAGVKNIIMATPPGLGGKPNAKIMLAALIAGADKVYLMGGAQAVAGLAYGTETIEKVDKIVGPGNIFVATAKKMLYGTVDIDMIAGPSEILILADNTADPEYLAADLMSQAEHDKMASAILITDDDNIADLTIAAIERQIKELSRKAIIEQSLDNYSGVIVCDNIEEGVAFANELAPEHMEICCNNPMSYIGKIDNVGSLFLGNYSPEPLGDYYAGPNHVLPTGGTARFFSPLSVDSFIKKSSFIYYTKNELLKASDDIITLADNELLTAHANAIKVRKDK
jgi:histidinol dehydrogenase